MRTYLRIALLLGIAGVTPTASAQLGVDDESYEDEDYVPTQGSSDLGQALRTGRGVVIGSGATRDSYTPIGVVPDVYTVRRGDTLWDITGRHFGNPWEWPRIWSYNPEITNPHWIYPLDRIRLRAGAEDTGDATLPASTSSVSPNTRIVGGTVRLRDEGYLDDDALQQAGTIVGSPEEHMLLAPYDDVYVEFGEGATPEPNREYVVYREIPETDRLEEEQGVLVRILGTVRLRGYDRDEGMGRAVIIDSVDPIERGMRVAPMERRFQMVAPVRNDRDVEAKVIAALHPRELLADQQVIFVSAGRTQGVREGNRFFVVRQGDVWQDERFAGDYGQTEPDPSSPDEFPPEIIAEARVVDVRDETATLIVTRSTREVVLGDRVEMREGF